ncbi:hypothetical protein Taro_032712 [Colocasia esculenta]|uniref:Uncharacterized protein n=1 Tax=Colocasia esculenta TaxID=4460 RepID=A0A843VTD9_COLES|nr:hypothetical protein [Colocasia esculenta]
MERKGKRKGDQSWGSVVAVAEPRQDVQKSWQRGGRSHRASEGSCTASKYSWTPLMAYSDADICLSTFIRSNSDRPSPPSSNTPCLGSSSGPSCVNCCSRSIPAESNSHEKSEDEPPRWSSELPLPKQGLYTSGAAISAGWFSPWEMATWAAPAGLEPLVLLLLTLLQMVTVLAVVAVVVVVVLEEEEREEEGLEAAMVTLEAAGTNEAADPGGEGGVGGGGAGDEVGSGVGAAEEACGLVVGPRCLLGRLEGAQPHAYLLGGVLDLRHPPPGGPLPHAHELAATGGPLVVAPSPGLHLSGFGGRRQLRLLEVDLHGWRRTTSVEPGRVCSLCPGDLPSEREEGRGRGVQGYGLIWLPVRRPVACPVCHGGGGTLGNSDGGTTACHMAARGRGARARGPSDKKERVKRKGSCKFFMWCDEFLALGQSSSAKCECDEVMQKLVEENEILRKRVQELQLQLEKKTRIAASLGQVISTLTIEEADN